MGAPFSRLTEEHQRAIRTKAEEICRDLDDASRAKLSDPSTAQGEASRIASDVESEFFVTRVVGGKGAPKSEGLPFYGCDDALILTEGKPLLERVILEICGTSPVTYRDMNPGP